TPPPTRRTPATRRPDRPAASAGEAPCARPGRPVIAAGKSFHGREAGGGSGRLWRGRSLRRHPGHSPCFLPTMEALASCFRRCFLPCATCHRVVTPGAGG